MTKKKKMKDKRNEEFLEQITAVIQKYDDMGIIADSYLIGGQQIEYIETVQNECYPSKEKIPSSLSLTCSGFINTEIVDCDPQVLLTKYKLINESANELYIDRTLGTIINDKSTKSSSLYLI